MELMRRAFRQLVGGYRSPVYTAAAQALNFAQLARQEGLGTARHLSRLAAAPPGPPECLTLRSLAHPILARPGTDDVPTIINTAMRGEYDQHIPHDWRPKTMIDGGAYIGDTSACFATRYPHLEIVALEPQADNFALAARNLAPYGPRIRLLANALSGTAGLLDFGGEQLGGSIGQTGAKVEAITVPQALAMLPGGRADLLKLDIEGAERDIMEASPGEWLPQVDLIIAELHGPAITRDVTAILRDHGFGARSFRSLTTFRRGW